MERSSGNSEDYDTFLLSAPEATRLRKVFEQLCSLRLKFFNQKTNKFEGNNKKKTARSKQSKQMKSSRLNTKNSQMSKRKSTKKKFQGKSEPFFTAREVAEQLKFLRSKWKDPKKSKPRFTKSEIDLMIWEVDEDLNKKIIWREFELMFKKCMKDERDRNGLEPRALFNLVRFMMFDQDNIGEIKAENTYELLYVRWKENDDFFSRKREMQLKNNISLQKLPYAVSFDEQIYELFNFQPEKNQQVYTNPDMEVRLTFFQYLDKINDLAISHRMEKKRKQMKGFSSLKK